jgi:hypothetical protein
LSYTFHLFSIVFSLSISIFLPSFSLCPYLSSCFSLCSFVFLRFSTCHCLRRWLSNWALRISVGPRTPAQPSASKPRPPASSAVPIALGLTAHLK